MDPHCLCHYVGRRQYGSSAHDGARPVPVARRGRLPRSAITSTNRAANGTDATRTYPLGSLLA
jgi:hypothetical protein